MRKMTITMIVLLCAAASVRGQSAFEGRTLISPLNSSDTFLMDMDENVLATWHGAANPASFAVMFADRSILRPCKDVGGQFQGGGVGGRIQKIDAGDTVVWDYYFSNAEHQQHHDIEPLPNGNVLLIAWETKTQQEALDAGRVSISGAMWPTLIVEVEPVGATGGNVVWEWHLWDHLVQDVDALKDNYGVVADHPELFDVNTGNLGPQNQGDWVHVNSIDYNVQLDQIVFSSRSINEFYVIDHSTTTAEAAGHTGGNSGEGGDFLYRWGNPQVYDRGSSSDQQFHVIHGVNWIDDGLPGAGSILAFDNGDRPGSANDYSTVVEVAPPVDVGGDYVIGVGVAFGPSSPTWSYGGPGVFYGGPVQCGAYRLPNGNTLISSVLTGSVFEVTEAGVTVWDYSNPSGVARAPRYWYAETPGDLNCDSSVNGLDVAAFVLALTDPAGYAAAYPGCYIHDADCNGDGGIDELDGTAFIDLVLAD